MPNTKSAKKKVRQDKKRKERNDRYRMAIKQARKAIKKAIEVKEDKNKIKELLVKFYSVVDKAAKRHVIHKNKAARLKSRVSKLVNQYLSA